MAMCSFTPAAISSAGTPLLFTTRSRDFPQISFLLQAGGRRPPRAFMASLSGRFWSSGSEWLGAVDCQRVQENRYRSSGLSIVSALFKTVPVQVARELLNAGHTYLDVRTPEEFSAGHVNNAVNIPYMHRGETGMTRNVNFVQEVFSEFVKEDKVVVGCQLGKRSQMAANELVAAGFTGVIDMAGGYAAWVQSDFPSISNR